MFWGDPHFITLDGANYTFNGLGEYVMIDAQNRTFQLQARTGLAQGNSTTATVFTAGAAKESNTATVEVRVRDGGKRALRGFNPKGKGHCKIHIYALISNRRITRSRS